MALLDDMVSHAGTMSEWFKEPGATHFMTWLYARRDELQKQLQQANDLLSMARLQGELNGVEKIIRVPGIIHESIQGKDTKYATTMVQKTR